MAATENEHGYVEGSSLDGPPLAPYPPYVQTEAQRHRWDVAYEIAASASALYEADGRPDSRVTWYGTRALYNSDTPTGESDVREDDQADEIVPAGHPLDGPEYEVDADERAREALAAARVAHEHGDLEAAHALALEALETMFGRVEDVPDPPGRVEEAAIEAPTLGGKFKEGMHPRTRVGEWANKLGGLKKSAGMAAAGVAAGATMKHEVVRSTFRGHPLHGDTRKLAREPRLRRDAAAIAKRTGMDEKVIHEKITAKMAAAHAREERTRESAVFQVKQKGLRGGTIAAGETLSTIHKALTANNVFEEHAEKLEAEGGRKNKALAVGMMAADAALPDWRMSARGQHVNAGTPAQDIQDTTERAHMFVDHAINLVQWAHDHADQLRLVGHAAHHVARGVGLMGADDREAGFDLTEHAG